MKKNLFFLLLLALAAMSCQKDIEQGSIGLTKTNEVTPVNSKETSLFDQTKPVENDDVFIKIDAFKAKLVKIEAGTMPETSEGTTVADAIWNIEALLNSRYGRAEKPFAKVARATNTIRVALNDDGTIDNAALLAAVNEAKQSLTSQYHALTDVEKHVIAIDIRKKEPQTESASSVFIDIEGMYGLREQDYLYHFLSDDYWHWGLELGKCDGPPTQQPWDAATKIGEKLNYRNMLQLRSVFFTDTEITGIFGIPYLNPNDVIRNDNIRDYLMFVQLRDLPNYNLYACLDPSDMNFYLSSTRDVIGFKRPTGKSFVSIVLRWDASVPDEDILHSGRVTYGIAHYNVETPIIP